MKDLDVTDLKKKSPFEQFTLDLQKFCWQEPKSS